MSPRKNRLDIINQIFEVISSAPAVTLMELSTKTGLSYPTLHRYLDLIEEIQKKPLIKKRKSGQNILYYIEKK